MVDKETAGSTRMERFLDSRWVLVAMVGAAFLYLLFFIGYPLVYNMVMSMQEVTFSNLASFRRPFVGFENYTAIFSDPLFPKILRNTVIFVAVNVMLQFALGLAMAMFFELKFPGAALMRGMILAGWILPPLVIGALWKWMLASEFGVVNEVLRWTGLAGDTIYWLSRPETSLISVVAANVWFGLPFSMILLTAGLSGIPRDLYEAAALDGASRARRFVFITLPMLRPTIYAVLALTTIYTLRAFDLIWGMTRGGPVDSSNIFPLWSYQLTFDSYNFGGGAAVSTLMFLIVFVVAFFYIRSIRTEIRM